MPKVMPTVDEFNVALLLLRVVVGPVFAFHGFAKIFRGGKLAGTASWFESLGVKPGALHARFAAFGELATGICLALGFLTSFAALGLVALMTVAVWLDHRGKGLLVTKGGWEYNLVLGAVAATIAMLGPGEISVDSALGIDLNGIAGLVISALGGVLAGIAFIAAFHRPPPSDSASSTAR